MAERRRAAIHEAGHAVASVALGFSLEKVTIAPDYERLSLGHTSAPDSVWGYGGADTQRRARDGIVVAYAGLAAEHVCCGEAFDFDDTQADHGSWGDHDAARSLLIEHVHVRGASYVGDDAYDAALVRLQAKAKRLIRQQRLSVERVATVLMDRETLTGQDVRELILGAPPHAASNTDSP